MIKEKIFQEKARVADKKLLPGGYFKLYLESRRICQCASAGQFVEIKASSHNEPLLRRPLGIHEIKNNIFSCLCQVVGKGTELLSRKKIGECLDVIGPLGRGFSIDRRLSLEGSILVAGGIGVAPLLFLAKELKNREPDKHREDNLLVLIGAKTKTQILCEKEFKTLGCSVKIATDDGSRGYRGYLSSLLEEELDSIIKPRVNIYACGPMPMLKEVARIARKNDICAQVSLEAHMACGIGACLGCTIDTKEGYKRVCKEGPVFVAEKVIW